MTQATSNINLKNIVKLVKKTNPSYSKNFQKALTLACDFLNKGDVIALPTDTLYGLAAKISHSKALSTIYQIKGRANEKPLAVCVSDIHSLDEVAIIKGVDNKLLTRLLPGPVTIVLPRSASLNEHLNPGIKFVGVRIPDNDFIREICRKVGPIALTSANRSGGSSCVRVDEFTDIWGDIGAIFDQGCLRSHSFHQSSGSTVFRLYGNKSQYSILRDGCAATNTRTVLKEFGYEEITQDNSS